MLTLEEEAMHTTDETDEESCELEIDLDYDEYPNVSLEDQDEPLDLSLNKDDNHKKNGIEPTNLLATEIESKDTNAGGKGTVITETEIAALLDPHVTRMNKKFICTVCDIKFATKAKALTHVENKHVECLLYKCPLCKVTKVTRLAYESHLRRGHVARVKDYCPLIRIKKKFSLKAERSQTNGQPCDLEFVTFLRHSLSLRQEVDTDEPSHTNQKAIACAEWIDRDQGIFRINNRQEFAKGWYTFKVNTHRCLVFKNSH